MNAMHSTPQDQFVSQAIELQINQIKNARDPIADGILAQIFDYDLENLSDTTDFSLDKYVFGDESEEMSMENVEFPTQIDVDNDGNLGNIKIEDLLQDNEFLNEIIESSLISEQEKAFPELTYHGEQITQFVQNTTTTISQPRDLAELVESLDIADESVANSFVLPAPVVSISGGDSGYGSPLYTYLSPSPSEYQYSQPLVIPSPTVQENAYEFQQRPRGRPACDWFDVDFINQLRASANGDPDKLKKINNNIASGQYRFNKKARKNATPCDSELMKLKNLNTKLRNQKRKNDEWIKKVQTVIASKALNVYSY